MAASLLAFILHGPWELFLHDTSTLEQKVEKRICKRHGDKNSLRRDRIGWKTHRLGDNHQTRLWGTDSIAGVKVQEFCKCGEYDNPSSKLYYVLITIYFFSIQVMVPCRQSM